MYLRTRSGVFVCSQFFDSDLLEHQLGIQVQLCFCFVVRKHMCTYAYTHSMTLDAHVRVCVCVRDRGERNTKSMKNIYIRGGVDDMWLSAETQTPNAPNIHHNLHLPAVS